MSQQPIGIFDSGIGGTSIWKEIRALMPSEHTLYLADSKHAPYGQKSKDVIIALSKKNTEYLLSKGAKIIVVACNTATTNAIEVLRNTYSVPFIGIEPAIKPAALQTKTQSVGILATQGTLSSALFSNTSAQFASNINVVEVVGEGLVPLIEEGQLDSPQMADLLSRYLRPMLAARIDHLVLGCSHYPYLIPLLKQLLPKEVVIIDSGLAVAKQTLHILSKNNLLNQNGEGRSEFLINASKNVLELVLAPFKDRVTINEATF